MLESYGDLHSFLYRLGKAFSAVCMRYENGADEAPRTTRTTQSSANRKHEIRELITATFEGLYLGSAIMREMPSRKVK